MASHSPSSFEQPLAVRSGREEARDTWLTFGKSLLFDADPVDDLVIRSAFLYVQGSLMSVVLVFGFEWYMPLRSFHSARKLQRA